MLARLCVVVPKLEPGMDAVPGAAHIVCSPRELDVVLVKVLAGLTDAFLFHNRHLLALLYTTLHKIQPLVFLFG